MGFLKFFSSVFPVLVLIASCQTPNEQVIRTSLAEVQPFVYDITEDEEATEDRVMKCFRKMQVEIPQFEVIQDEDEEFVLVDCMDGGFLISAEDYVNITNNIRSNIANIPHE